MGTAYAMNGGMYRHIERLVRTCSDKNILFGVIKNCINRSDKAGLSLDEARELELLVLCKFAA